MVTFLWQLVVHLGLLEVKLLY